MLKRLTAPPTNLGKQSEIHGKEAGAFDRVTGDSADLRTHSSADGKQKFLRVWSVDASGKEQGDWFEITKAPEPVKDPTKQK